MYTAYSSVATNLKNGSLAPTSLDHNNRRLLGDRRGLSAMDVVVLHAVRCFLWS